MDLWDSVGRAILQQGRLPDVIAAIQAEKSGTSA